MIITNKITILSTNVNNSQEKIESIINDAMDTRNEISGNGK